MGVTTVMSAKYKVPSAKPNKKWFKDRMDKLDISQNKLGEMIGLDWGAMSRTLAGKRTMKYEEVNKVSKIFEVPYEEVLLNLGIKARKANDEIIICGWVDKDLNVHYGEPKGPKEAPNPAKMGGVEVLRMQTAGGKYEGMDGGLVYFHKLNGIVAEAVGKLCVVKIGGKSVMAKLEKLRNVKRGYGADRYNLYSIAGEVLEEEVALETAHPVIWMKM